MAEKEIGSVTHYYGKIGVAGITLTDALSVGDTVHFAGHTSDFSQEVDSIEIDHQAVESAGAGDQIGLKVGQRVRIHDKVLLVEPD